MTTTASTPACATSAERIEARLPRVTDSSTWSGLDRRDRAPSAAGVTAIDQQGHSRDEGGVVAGEKRGGGRDLLGLSEPAERVELGHIVPHLFVLVEARR